MADLTSYWDAEGQRLLEYDDQPLVFENLTTIRDHDEHCSTLDYLHRSDVPAIVVAGGGMCTGGRVVNYLKALLDRPNTDVLFLGYQGRGTPGRAIQDGCEWVELDGKRHAIRAKVHRIGGYSAHADQQGLLEFVSGMDRPPGEIVLVHGEEEAKAALKAKLEQHGLNVR